MNPEDPYGIKDAKRLLDEAERKYGENKQKRWIYAVLGMVILSLIAYFGAFAMYEIDHSFLDRTSMDTLLQKTFGNYGIKDALSDDLFLISYSYNFGIPRFFTKHLANNDTYSLDYDVKLQFAAAATSATPFFFDPVTRYAFNTTKQLQ